MNIFWQTNALEAGETGPGFPGACACFAMRFLSARTLSVHDVGPIFAAIHP